MKLDTKTDIDLSDFTDRERLGFAFDRLNAMGYCAPLEFAWSMCCNSCGQAEIVQRTGEADPDYVFWHMQKDDAAFFVNDIDSVPMGYRDMEDYTGMMETEEWKVTNMMHRIYDHPNLVESLYLHWSGNAKDIVDVLVEHGLDAQIPDSEEHCIEVKPK